MQKEHSEVAGPSGMNHSMMKLYGSGSVAAAAGQGPPEATQPGAAMVADGRLAGAPEADAPKRGVMEQDMAEAVGKAGIGGQQAPPPSPGLAGNRAKRAATPSRCERTADSQQLRGRSGTSSRGCVTTCPLCICRLAGKRPRTSASTTSSAAVKPQPIWYSDLGGVEAVLGDIRELIEYPLKHPEVRL